MIQTLAKQGGRRYGQMRNTGVSAVSLRNVGAFIFVFHTWWATFANKTIGLLIEPT